MCSAFWILTICGILGIGYRISTAPPKPEPVTLKYTVWMGSVMAARGYQTNDYIIKDNFISFTTREGEYHFQPTHHLWRIQENKND